MDKNLFKNSKGNISIARVIAGLAAITIPLIGLATAALQIPAIGNFVAQKLLPGNQDVGLIAVFKQSNDFISSEKGRLKDHIMSSKEEMWFFGSSFYISIPQFEDAILTKLQECVKFTVVMLDPDSEDYSIIAKTMGYTQDRLTYIVKESISALLELDKKRRKHKICSQFEIWLTKHPFTSRIYMFDPKQDSGATYLIPQVYGKDSTKLPGFLLSNSSDKYYMNYLSGIQELSNGDSSTSLDDWIKKHPGYVEAPR